MPHYVTCTNVGGNIFRTDMVPKQKLMRLIQIVLLLFVVACGQGQNGNKSDKKDKSLLTLLKEGDHKADVMDKVTMPPRTQELMAKFQAAIKKNPDWFLEVQKKVKETGQPLPYDERIGMTEEEYADFLDLMQNNNGMEMTKSSTETVSIKHSEGKIVFKGTGTLDILNDVSIDLSGQLANIGQFKLEQIDSVNVTDDKNALKSKWTGVAWRFETSNKNTEDLKTTEDYQDLNMKIYKVTLGQLERTKKLYMQIQKSEIANGQKTLDIKLPFIFE